MEGINLDLIMCGLLMEESSIKIASVQNQNYFMDKGRSLSLVKKKKKRFGFRIIGGIVKFFVNGEIRNRFFSIFIDASTLISYFSMKFKFIFSI